MSWNDDFDDDEHGARRPDRARATGWQIARRTAGYAAIVVGVSALVVGTVVAVNLVGTAANPGGFAAPAAYGSRLPLPPTTTEPDQSEIDDSEPSDEEALAEDDGATIEEPTEISGADTEAMALVDPEWAGRVSAATDIPERALSAYALAHVVIAAEEPECGLDWATIAAIGSIESGHGSHGATSLDEAGNAQPPIIGRALDGNGVAKIADTDGGVLDGDATWDRAVGPMQFIPSTWMKWAKDANGDGVAEPNQIDDAALTTAHYLCASGSMTSPEGWRAAVYSYNHDNDYVDKVAKVALGYAESAR